MNIYGFLTLSEVDCQNAMASSHNWYYFIYGLTYPFSKIVTPLAEHQLTYLLPCLQGWRGDSSYECLWLSYII